ncbi:MAG: polyhydroxybutyrate depolymerase [Anaerolineae bacterium]|nr:polyhydroxybutyrate depolymerase [Anaerolineae bacterium]
MITQLMKLVLLLVVFGVQFNSGVGAQSAEVDVRAQHVAPLQENTLQTTTCPAMPDFARSELVMQTIEYSDVQRFYYLYIPASYDTQTPVPLVFAIHGFAQGALGLAGYSGWEAVAEENGFILVYPQGSGVIARWETGLFAGLEGEIDDVRFFSDMIDTISQSLCIDSTRVYANGLSNGGGMSYRLACQLSDRITAIGGVAGAYTEFGGCEPNRSIPFILFHGTADSIVPYEGGDSAMFNFPSIESFTLTWAERNECDLNAQSETIADDVTRLAYTDCSGGADVILYTVLGGGHTWAGANLTRLSDRFGGYVTQSISASELMWAFFSQYTLEGKVN